MDVRATARVERRRDGPAARGAEMEAVVVEAARLCPRTAGGGNALVRSGAVSETSLDDSQTNGERIPDPLAVCLRIVK